MVGRPVKVTELLELLSDRLHLPPAGCVGSQPWLVAGQRRLRDQPQHEGIQLWFAQEVREADAENMFPCCVVGCFFL